METKHKVFNLVILDESGSMEMIKRPTISGFNELADTIRGVERQYPEQEHLISFVTFNGHGIRTLLWNQPAAQLQPIDGNRYQPYSSTPLYDAMGFGITRLRAEVEPLKEYNVLVTVLTDGEENASREYTGAAVKKLVDELSAGNWTFTYMGANHDVAAFAMKISITNTLQFEASAEDVHRMFREEKNARINYSRKIRDKEDFKRGYFDKDDDNTRDQN